MGKKGCERCGEQSYKPLCSKCLNAFDFAEYEGEINEVTYDLDDDKLRLYCGRVPRLLWAALTSEGFGRAPKQGYFFAVWSPRREDIALSFVDEIEEEGSTIEERAAAKAERLEMYADNAAQHGHQRLEASEAVAARFEGGQPILVGHHSEDRARKDKERMESHARKGIAALKQAKRWAYRATRPEAHAAYLKRHDVVRRRIKKIKARLRKWERDREIKDWSWSLRQWRNEHIGNQYDEANQRPLTPEEQKQWEAHKAHVAQSRAQFYDRWIWHNKNRLAYWEGVYEAVVPEEALERLERDYQKGQWALRSGWRGPVYGQIVRVNKSRTTGEVSTLSMDKITFKGQSDYYIRKWKPQEIVHVLDHEPTKEQMEAAWAWFKSGRGEYKEDPKEAAIQEEIEQTE
ncbi:DUF3560 domain-containing protein [Candidatus Uhrbacteria bacterium]|nr:DUF3560 domain-containing protein [Candidatus Uhrbacteria bacterium]